MFRCLSPFLDSVYDSRHVVRRMRISRTRRHIDSPKLLPFILIPLIPHEKARIKPILFLFLCRPSEFLSFL